MAEYNYTQEQLTKIISETVNEYISNGQMLEEGIGDYIRSMYQGAKRGYETQRISDEMANNANMGNFKREHDSQDTMYAMSHPMSKMPRTAKEQAEDIYDLFLQYRSTANKLLAQYKELVKKAQLQIQYKTTEDGKKGKRIGLVDPNVSDVHGNVPNMASSVNKRQPRMSQIAKRNPNNIAASRLPAVQ